MTSTVLQRQSLNTRVTLGTLAIFLLSLWSLTFYVSDMLREDMRRLLGAQQLSTVSYVATEIDHGLVDRWQALRTVAGTISPAALGQPTAMQTVLEQLPLLQMLFNGGVVAYRLDGTAIAEMPRSAGRIGVNYMDIDTIAAALKAGQSTIGRPVMDKKLLTPMFGMTVPLRDTQGRVFGALSGVIHLGQPGFLDIITENRDGKNGSFMLVAPQYRLVVTATDKRRIMEAMPAPGLNPMIDRFLGGYQGSEVSMSPHGVEVLASARAIPTAGWYVVGILPSAQAFAPVRAMQRRMLAATILFTLLAGGLTWWMVRRQLAPMLVAARTLAAMQNSNQPPQPLAVTRQDEVGQLISGFNRLLETLALREADLRIAAIAFECQEGMIVTDANQVILRTNQSFTRIMGYTNEEVVGKSTAFMRSNRHPAAFYDAAWEAAQKTGSWHAEVWHRRKNGEVFPQWLTSTAVKDEQGNITHYVVTHMDITSQKQQEAKRRLNEATQRDTLVREVHHRIKNNLQGITGLLRQFVQHHPETAEPINQAISQVQGISVIHGLQGGAVASSVQLCELTSAIAAEVQNLWQTPVILDIPPACQCCVIANNEAVPIALVLNELIVNAVKHGGQTRGPVRITVRKGDQPEVVQVDIVNAGQLPPGGGPMNAAHAGLKLIAALMPHHGARLVREQQGDQVMTRLELAPPTISIHQGETT